MLTRYTISLTFRLWPLFCAIAMFMCACDGHYMVRSSQDDSDALTGAYADGQRDSLYRAKLLDRGRESMGNNDYAQALKWFTLCMNSAEQYDDYPQLVLSTGNLGLIFFTFGDNGSASLYLKKAYDIAQSHSLDEYAALYADNLVLLYCDMQDASSASEYARHYDRLAGSGPHESYCRLRQAFLIAMVQEDKEAAVRTADQLLELSREAPLDQNPFYIVAAYSYKTESLQMVGRLRDALEESKKCVEAARESGLNRFYFEGLQQMAGICHLLGDDAEAAKCHAAIVAVQDSVYRKADYDSEKSRWMRQREQAVVDNAVLMTNTINGQRQAIWTLVLLTLILGGALWLIISQYRRLKRQNLLLYRQSVEIMEDDRDLAGGTCVNTQHTSLPGDDCKDIPDSFPANAKLIEDIRSSIARNYSNPEFCLEMLVRDTGSNTQYVSNAVNRHLGGNFKGVLAERRVRRACALINEAARQARELDMMGIMNSVGFSSASPFYFWFKKIVGMTPRQYYRIAIEQNKKGVGEIPDTIV